jgi:hypothetical protein
MRTSSLLLSVALLGCGNSNNGSGDGSREANYLADRFDADCRRVAAPNPKLAKELDQLCSCSTKQIRQTVHDGDPRAVTDKKIDQARLDCLRQVYPNG